MEIPGYGWPFAWVTLVTRLVRGRFWMRSNSTFLRTVENVGWARECKAQAGDVRIGVEAVTERLCVRGSAAR